VDGAKDASQQCRILRLLLQLDELLVERRKVLATLNQEFANDILKLLDACSPRGRLDRELFAGYPGNLLDPEDLPACGAGSVFVTLVTFMSMVPNSATPGIRFNDCLFSEPVGIGAWPRTKCAGLLAILVTDPNWAPKAFQTLYFGEFGNNAPLPLLPQDYARLMAAAQGRALYICVLPMPFSTTAQRFELRNELVRAYNPDAQTTATAMQQAPETPRRRIGFMPQTESTAA
jgi:hypothetical protein